MTSCFPSINDHNDHEHKLNEEAYCKNTGKPPLLTQQFHHWTTDNFVVFCTSLVYEQTCFQEITPSHQLHKVPSTSASERRGKSLHMPIANAKTFIPTAPFELMRSSQVVRLEVCIFFFTSTIPQSSQVLPYSFHL